MSVRDMSDGEGRWLTRAVHAAILACMSCGGAGAFTPCDIRQSSCQQDVFLAVQRVRGEVPDPWLDQPPMRVISKATCRAEVLADFDDSPEPMQGEEGFDHFGHVLELLRLIDPQSNDGDRADARLENVAAFYSWKGRAQPAWTACLVPAQNAQ